MAIDYGTRRDLKEFLIANPVGVVSTVSDDGKPWGAAVNFVPDDAFEISFVTRNTTAKSQNLAANRRASFTVFNSSQQRTVQIYGEVSQVSAMDAQSVSDRIAAANAERGQVPPYVKLEGGQQVVYRLRPSYMQYSDFMTESAPGTADYVKQIIPG
jgi:flavin reductase (DIM6/NTAB) family NADH-FMN oxidoreductase RutF